MNTSISTHARQKLLQERFEPLLLAEWSDAVFLHYAVLPEALQPQVPFPLDLHEGLAYVSLVAFTMKAMRPRIGGTATAWLFTPIATHEFLNVRTYVTHNGEAGIYFLAEWLPNALSVKLGPPVFGLPYRLGRNEYQHDAACGFRGCVQDRASGYKLRYHAEPVRELAPDTAEAGTLTEFLLERYNAFTTFVGLRRRFRVWHPAWLHQAIEAVIEDDSLLSRTGEWHREARFFGAHFAPGFKDIWMGRPRFV